MSTKLTFHRNANQNICFFVVFTLINKINFLDRAVSTDLLQTKPTEKSGIALLVKKNLIEKRVGLAFQAFDFLSFCHEDDISVFYRLEAINHSNTINYK